MDEQNADTRRLVEKIEELKLIHMLDMAEIVRLRRMVEALIDEKES